MGFNRNDDDFHYELFFLVLVVVAFELTTDHAATEYVYDVRARPNVVGHSGRPSNVSIRKLESSVASSFGCANWQMHFEFCTSQQLPMPVPCAGQRHARTCIHCE